MWTRAEFTLCVGTLFFFAGCLNSNEPEQAVFPRPAAKSSSSVASSWKIHDGFESGVLDPHWTPYSQSIGSITSDFAHRGTHSFRVTYSDFKYTFDNPIKDGQISWSYLEGSGTPWSYMYILTDTTQANLVESNLHVVTNFTDSYSFYHFSVGYKYGVPRLPGWRKFVANIKDGKISVSVDGQLGITVNINAAVIAFQIAGAVIDDLKANSN